MIAAPQQKKNFSFVAFRIKVALALSFLIRRRLSNKNLCKVQYTALSCRAMPLPLRGISGKGMAIKAILFFFIYMSVYNVILRACDCNTFNSYRQSKRFLSLIASGNDKSSFKDTDKVKNVCTAMRQEQIASDIASLPEAIGNNDSFDFFLVGFIDGEGCFSVSFRKLERLTLGIEVRPSFSVGQKKTNANLELLKKIQTRFQGGNIRIDKNKKDSVLYKYETRSLDHIKKEIIPFFKKHTLQTEKKFDFLRFCEICSLMEAKQHLKCSGLLTILEIGKKMNVSGKRRISIESLRFFLETLPNI